MAETSLGGISWYVDADTSPAVNGTKQLDQAIDKVESNLKGMDTQVTKTARSVNSGLSSIGRKAGQAGIQLQQLIGQIQGGQGAMLALSQQGADLGFVLGAPLLGAIVGISASLAGMLLPSIFDTDDAAEELEKTLSSLSKVVSVNSDGVNVLSNDFALLAKRSRDLAEAQLALSMTEAVDVITQSRKAADDAVDSFDTLFGALQASVRPEVIESLDDALERTGLTTKQLLEETDLYATGLSRLKDAAEQLNDELGITTDQSVSVIRAISEFRQDRSSESLKNLSDVLSGIVKSSKSATPELTELAFNISKMSFESMNAENVIKLLEKALKDLDGTLDASSAKTEKVEARYKSIAESMLVRYQKSRIESLKLEKQLTLERAKKDKVSEATKAAVSASYDLAIAKEREKQATKESTQALREDYKAFKIMDKLRREAESKKQKEQEQATGFAQGIAERGMSEADVRQQEQDKLKELYQQGLIAESEYQAAMTQLQAEGMAARQQSIQSAMGQFASAFDSLANTFAQAKGKQSAEYKAMFALSKGFAVAQAGLNLALSISQASTLPWPANLGAMAQAAASGAAIVAQVGSAVYGGREHGGSVLGGKTYEVGEKNKPELLMIPGNKGKVFSNSEAKAMMGGGSQLKQTINNYAAADGYQVRTRGDGVTHEQVIDIIRAESANPNSHMRRNLTAGTNIQNQISGGRI